MATRRNRTLSSLKNKKKKSGQTLEDGRQRKRNMLLAEKKEPADDNVEGFEKPCFHTAVRGMHSF